MKLFKKHKWRIVQTPFSYKIEKNLGFLWNDWYRLSGDYYLASDAEKAINKLRAYGQKDVLVKNFE